MLSDEQAAPAPVHEPRASRLEGVNDWMVVVPTRGDAEAMCRIERNIASRLAPRTVLVVRNGNISAGHPPRLAGADVIDVPGGGVSRARNAALDAATTRTVVFVDDDVVASAAALRVLVARQREYGAAVALARVLPANARHHPLFDGALGFDRGSANRVWSGAGADAKPRSPLRAYEFGVGAAFAVDRELLDADCCRPRFDERLSNGRLCGGSEDLDFFYAAHVAGHTVCYVADAVVQHLFPRTVARKCRQYALTDGAFYAKWASRISGRDLLSELAGWCGRVRRRGADRAAGRPAVPLTTLMAEPAYKLAGGVLWALVLRRSS